jgi:iron complex outermembrane receptor protein
MSGRFQWHLLSTTAVALGLTCGLHATAHAQATSTAPATKSGKIEEVVVTARKRSERLQKVPVAVTVLGASQLAQQKIVNVNDLGAVTPSLTFQQSSYSPFGSYVGIRGQKTSETILSETPSIGIYVDDVYQPSTIGTGIGGLEDDRQIEVLKGPQGTLYGRNTTGGAVKITTNPPDYTGFYGSVTTGFGNYNSNEDDLMLNVPLVADKAAMRIDFQRLSHNGFGQDVGNGRPLDDEDIKNGRIALRLDPTSDLEITVRANVADGRSGGPVSDLAAIEPVFGVTGAPTFSPALLNTGLQIGSLTFAELLPFLAPAEFGPPTAADYAPVIAGQEKAYAALKRYLKTGYNVDYDYPNSVRLKNDGGSVNAVYTINDSLSLKSITSYQYALQDSRTEIDSTPFQILQGPGDVSTLDQLTQEIQLNGTALDNRLNFSTGIFYYYLTASDDSPGEVELPFLNAAGSPVNTRDHLTDESVAAYAQGTYAITPNIHFTGGLRGTYEKTGLTATGTDGPENACNVPPPAAVNGAPCADTFSSQFRDLSYTVGVDWSVTNNILLYVKSSRGDKAGGQNQRGSVVGGFDAFKPEHVTDVEVGEKADFLDHRLRVNVAAYRSNYTDIQRDVLTVTPDDQTITEVRNAASATIQGFEGEVTAKPVPWLTPYANAAYTSAAYNKYYAGALNFTGHAFEDQPLWQFNVGATYSQAAPIGQLDGTLTGTVNFAYQSSVNFAPDTISVYSNKYPLQGGYGLLNARVAYDIPKYGITIAGWGKNLTDRKYLVGTTDVTSALGIGNEYLSNPMTFGFDITKRF